MRLPCDRPRFAGREVAQPGDQVDREPDGQKHDDVAPSHDAGQGQSGPGEGRPPGPAVDGEPEARRRRHHARNRARRPDDHGCVAGMDQGVQQDGRRGRRDPECAKTNRPDAVRERRPEGGQPDRVNREMENIAMQQRVGHRRRPGVNVDVEPPGISGRNEGGAHEEVEILARRQEKRPQHMDSGAGSDDDRDDGRDIEDRFAA